MAAATGGGCSGARGGAVGTVCAVCATGTGARGTCVAGAAGGGAAWACCGGGPAPGAVRVSGGAPPWTPGGVPSKEGVCDRCVGQTGFAWATGAVGADPRESPPSVGCGA